MFKILNYNWLSYLSCCEVTYSILKPCNNLLYLYVKVKSPPEYCHPCLIFLIMKLLLNLKKKIPKILFSNVTWCLLVYMSWSGEKRMYSAKWYVLHTWTRKPLNYAKHLSGKKYWIHNKKQLFVYLFVRLLWLFETRATIFCSGRPCN